MAERGLAKQSVVFYYALVTSRAASALAEFRHSGKLPQASSENLRRYLEILRRVLRGQELVRTRTEKIIPDTESIQVYRHMLEAVEVYGVLGPEADVGEVSRKLAVTLEAVLAGEAFNEIGEEAFAQLERVTEALASVLANKTAKSALSDDPVNLFEWPPLLLRMVE